MRAGRSVLVTGGAGYIGSHVVLALLEDGWPVVVLDDLSTGRAEAVPSGVPLVRGSTGDIGLARAVLRQHRVGAVIHLAGSMVVPESVAQPLGYWRNNVANTGALAEACVAERVSKLVFSSTAAVYGIPERLPVTEETPCLPINPYGASKHAAECLLQHAAAAHGFSVLALRYFNVAGADPAGRTGQRKLGATHLIQVACEAALGRRREVVVFGDDHDTPDGTGVRDYIHVSDLADAHVAGLRHLASGGRGLVLNCGYGRGYSVREVIRAVERTAGVRLAVRVSPRRVGDPPAMVASAERIRGLLRWRPSRDDLDGIIADALPWERRLTAPPVERRLRPWDLHA